MSARRLLLDAGNTRLKWAEVKDGHWLQQGGVAYADLQTLEHVLQGGPDCFIASVANAQHEGEIQALLASFGVVPRWLKVHATSLGVVNSYADPAQLGVDRWMGLLAARRRSSGATLVVSAGTAMTVDALMADGVFQGGLIVPGVSLMQRSLQQGTARVGETAGHWQAFPRTTADAVHSGVLAALCGAIQQQYTQLASVSDSEPHCLLTGGDAELLLPHLSMPAELVPALVLEGVDLVAREGESE